MAQNPGDTIRVNALDYSSNSRDTNVNFPSNSSVTYERVIMRYAMRCKNALVSTGSQRNLGCGEWDYSCNTYIHNPNLADSVLRTTSKYSISPSPWPDSVYSISPTYSQIPSLQSLVTLNSIIGEDTSLIGPATNNDSTVVNSRARNGKSYVYYTAAQLQGAGLLTGAIHGLSLLSMSTASIPVGHLKIRINQSATDPIAQEIDTAITNHLQEVYYHNYIFNPGENRFQFHTPFNWDGTSGLLVELSYRGNEANPPLQLGTFINASSLFSYNDYGLNLFSGNYVEANNYYGITGTNDRTVEAWIKTTSGGEITTWGTNSTGQKQSFWVNGNGQLRLEINGAFAIGTRAVNDGKWHHVAYTFSGSNMYGVKFYVDGVWDFSSQVNTKPVNTGNSFLLQISKGFHNRYFDGEIDNIRVWSAELSANTLKNWRHRKAYFSGFNHPNYNDLELAYPIDQKTSSIEDKGPNNYHANFTQASFSTFSSDEIFKEFESHFQAPSMTFYQGTYNQTVSNDTVIDTVYNAPYYVTERSIFPRSGTTQSDSIAFNTSQYYPKSNSLYDLNGNIVSSSLSTNIATLGQRTLSYYQRNPSKVEIMSFVTPYGINLDLGVGGKAWYFDVTDFLPVLQGNRRISLERGGQNQEEMDIDFLFIVGTPPAEVKSIQQIWKVDQRNYTQINNNDYFAPRTIRVDTSARRYKIRSAITGHGQQGEFIARNHTITINNGATTYNNLVWKECAENPVYPQGGTWVYDRAGWCPGMATDVKEYDVTSFVNGDSINVEYNVSTASGDSRYIVNNQLVSYGPANFTNDARITQVRRPTQETEFGRLNPTCFNPIVTIQNTGSGTMTSADIEYWINNGPRQVQSWSGSLAFMQEANVQLFPPAGFWAAGAGTKSTFRARILTVNGSADQYATNDSIRSTFQNPDTLPSSFVLVLKTNNRAFENSIQIRNSAGVTVYSRNGFSNNTVYSDTISAAGDCFQLRLFDTGDDGLSFFANNAGTGYFRIVDPNTGLTIRNFNPDFGDRVEYYYSVDMSTAIPENEALKELEVYPNPVDETLNIKGNLDGIWTLSNAIGQACASGSIQKGQKLSQIPVAGFKPGIYILRIESESKLRTEKIVIN